MNLEDRMADPASFECGILLHPAGHTRSPAMHRAAFAALGLNATYEAHDVPPDELADTVVTMRSRGVRQLAVSIPHKESMMAHVDEVEPVGVAIGAINTVTLTGDRWIGTNTDWLGALRALERETKLTGQRAVVLGAGGASRAVVYGLVARGCEVFVLNRTLEKAETLVAELGAEAAMDYSMLSGLQPTLLVNTTSIGMGEDASPVDAGALHDEMVVLDAVYAPPKTRLLKDAEARGARIVGGKWMLVYQALAQLRHWTKTLPTPPRDDEIDALTEVMAEAFDHA